MELHEWEIWHTYSSTIQTGAINLESLAERLVCEGVAYTVLHRDGLTFWQGAQSKGIGKGATSINLDPAGVAAKFQMHPKDDQQPELAGFAREAWYQASLFRCNEKRVFHPDSDLPPPYLRAYLGQCNLISDQNDKYIRLYPVVVIYDTGVILVEFRTISPKQPVDLAHFIRGGINLYEYGFDRIEGPPGLVRLATRAWYHSHPRWRFHHRATLLYLERGHDIAVDEQTQLHEETDFEFELAPLSSSGEEERLHSFALTIMHVFAFVAVAPRKGLGFLLRGQKPIAALGHYWEGRPHVYLMKRIVSGVRGKLGPAGAGSRSWPAGRAGAFRIRSR